MAYIKFKKIVLSEGQDIENWLGNNTPDANTRYTFFDNNGDIEGEYIGNKEVVGFTPENTTNKVTTITASSTNTQYPSAKAVYDAINNAIIAGINGGY